MKRIYWLALITIAVIVVAYFVSDTLVININISITLFEVTP